MSHTGWWLAAAMALAGGLMAAEPGSAPAPGDMTFIEEETAEGAESPVNPFGEPSDGGPRKDAVPARVELSSGATVAGRIYTTRGKRLKIFNLERGMYEYVPVPAVREIETIVEWERMEREWRFKEAGSPEKVYTGREYPARKFAYRLTLLNGHTITGHILGQPLTLARPSRASGSNDGEEVDRFILHDRQKGDFGQTLEDLLYLRRITLHEEGNAEVGTRNSFDFGFRMSDSGFNDGRQSGARRPPSPRRATRNSENIFGWDPRKRGVFLWVGGGLESARGVLGGPEGRKPEKQPCFERLRAGIGPEKTSNHLAMTSRHPRKTSYPMEQP